MKTLSGLLLAIVLMFSLAANAQRNTKNMLEQISYINNSWRPTIGKSIYEIKEGTKSIVVLCLYDTSKSDADPERDDVQAVFVKTKGEYKLTAVVFSSIDRVLTNIELVIK